MEHATELLRKILEHLAEGDSEAAAAHLAKLAPMLDAAKWPRAFADGRRLSRD